MKARALFLAVPLMALAACTDDPSVQIQAICFPTDDCTFGDTCDTLLMGNPIVDGSTPLTLFLQVANQVSNNADPATGRVNTHDAHVEETIVGGASMLMSSSWIPAQGSTVVGVTIPPIGGLIAVQMRGRFDDGTTFETAEFPIFVQTCSGCIGTCPVGEIACPGPGQLPFTCFDPTGGGTT
jgi:hypothetical protein